MAPGTISVPDGSVFLVILCASLLAISLMVRLCASLLAIIINTCEPRHEKTNILHMRKQRRRSASR